MSFNFDPNDAFGSFEMFSQDIPADGCTQCSMCLPRCPTYQKTSDPEQSPMGRIRIMRELENNTDIETGKLESCLGCYSCEAICPSKVNFGKMLDESLAKVRQHRPLPRITRIMLLLAKKHLLLKPLIKIAWLTQVSGLRALLKNLGPFKSLTLQRADALLGNINYPASLNNRIQRARNEQRVALFTGCFSSALESKVQQATIDVLNTLNYEVIIPTAQGCCGALHRHNGELDTAEKMAKKNIMAFSADKVNSIISTSSGCGASLKDYGEWLKDEEIKTPVMDISQYLLDILQNNRTPLNKLALKVALHTPCTLRQHEGQEEAVNALLQKVPGLEITALSGEPRCCGAGGSQMLGQPEMADALGDDLINEVRMTAVDVLVSSNLGCALHLKARLSQAGFDIPLQHPVQLIARAMGITD